MLSARIKNQPDLNFDLTNLTIITQSEIKNDKLILLCDSPGDIDVKTLVIEMLHILEFNLKNWNWK